MTEETTKTTQEIPKVEVKNVEKTEEVRTEYPVEQLTAQEEFRETLNWLP